MMSIFCLRTPYAEPCTFSLMPNGLRLRLNAALCTEYGYRTVQYTQGALYLYGKVNVARVSMMLIRCSGTDE